MLGYGECDATQTRESRTANLLFFCVRKLSRIRPCIHRLISTRACMHVVFTTLMQAPHAHFPPLHLRWKWSHCCKATCCSSHCACINESIGSLFLQLGLETKSNKVAKANIDDMSNMCPKPPTHFRTRGHSVLPVCYKHSSLRVLASTSPWTLGSNSYPLIRQPGQTRL